MNFFRTVPNCIMKAKSEKRRPFYGNQIEECRDISGLFYILSFTKGYITNWEVQKNVFDHVWEKEYPVNLHDSGLIITEPIFNFSSIQEAMVEIFFEEYEPLSLTRCTAPDLAQYNYVNSQENTNILCCLVVDLGYSFSHIIPYVKGEKVLSAIRRIDVGGKLLTNHLKEIISYRQLNVMDETYVINLVKEDTCFVSQNFYEDMRIAKEPPSKNDYICEYVLPDCTTIKKGFMQPYGTAKKSDDYQYLKLNNERFSVPEILFHPSDVGITQMGISEAIIDAINACPEETRPHLYANIIVVGGSAKFPGLLNRLQKDVRSMAPEWFHVNVSLPENPQTYAWQGAKYFIDDENEFDKLTITRQQYNESGSARELLFGEN
jgi:actin-related protein 6